MNVILIRDLEPEEKKKALANQVLQGNPANESIPLISDKSRGGFLWAGTPEKREFWEKVYNAFLNRIYSNQCERSSVTSENYSVW